MVIYTNKIRIVAITNILPDNLVSKDNSELSICRCFLSSPYTIWDFYYYGIDQNKPCFSIEMPQSLKCLQNKRIVRNYIKPWFTYFRY